MGQFLFVANGGGGIGPGTGDVVGPAGSNDGTIVLFDGITGKLIKDSGILPDPFVGDTGLGGQIGFVPAPAAGDAADYKYLNANGNWEQINQDQILPGFSIASFTKTAPGGGTLLYERGETISGPNLTVAATYISGPPVAPTTLANTIYGNVGGDVTPAGWAFVAPFASGLQSAGVKLSGNDLDPVDPFWTIDLSATGSAVPVVDTASLTVSWTRQVYWGVSATDPLTEADIEGLGNNVLSRSKSRTVSVSPVNQYFYYCFPQAYGTVTMTSGGFGVDLEAPYAVFVTNTFGVTSTYSVFRTTFLLTGPFTFVVT